MRKKPIRRPEDIPEFQSEAELVQFFDTHYCTAEFYRAAPTPKESLAARAMRQAAGAAKHVEQVSG